QRLSSTGRYGTSWPESLRLDPRELDDLAPFLGFVGDELAEVGRGARKQRAAQVREARLDLGIGEADVNLLVELLDDLGGRVLGPAHAEPPTCLIARHEVA